DVYKRQGLGRAGGDGSAVPETAGPDGMPQSPRYQRAAYMETSTPAGGHLQQRGRERFTVTCSECGAQTSVPFKPDPNRPVYCRSCYVARRGGPKPENR
ncbi:MAG: hypothetical protein N3A38_03330, partial [Planctomycetota bacterium]|nr:hypothetical protein [Planctomycetota bacterium]